MNKEFKTTCSERCCRFCRKTFTRNQNLKQHERKCANKHGLRIDNEVMSYPDNRKKKKKVSSNCNFCSRRFSSRKSCILHMRQCQIGGVKNRLWKYKYRCLSCNEEFETINGKENHYRHCIGSGLDHPNIHKNFKIIRMDKFKDSVFEYHVVPVDNSMNYLTNLSLWNMIITVKPIIEEFQMKRKKYPLIKKQSVLVSKFDSSTTLDIKSAFNEDTNEESNSTEIYLRGKRIYECYPGKNVYRINFL